MSEQLFGPAPWALTYPLREAVHVQPGKAYVVGIDDAGQPFCELAEDDVEIIGMKMRFAQPGTVTSVRIYTPPPGAVRA